VGVVAAPSHMAGDLLALDEDLYGTRCEPNLDFAASEAVGNAIEVMLGLDVIIDADAAEAALGEYVRFYRQGLERQSVKLLQELPAGFSEAADRPFFVEASEHLADPVVQVRETMEHAVAQTTAEPALDDEYAALDFRFVAGSPWPCRQDRRAVMSCHVGIGSVDLRLVETGF
jgi:hypothetical protein